ncbi:MAG TPA: helix-turn-helix transcriptional regulator [Terriglobia bacterium]|nr:helix-turn-helix transcriptional regulator [Terriglobia bacterium]
MLIGDRLRQLREERGLSQGDVEKVSGLLRCYISRVEHGHTVPSLDSLEKFAHAFDVPLFQLFYEGGKPAPTPHLTPRRSLEEVAAESGKGGVETRFLLVLKGLATKMVDADRDFFLDFARKLATR